MKVLDHRTIAQKIKRLAFEILEHNYEEKEILIAGINNSGMVFANLLLTELKKIEGPQTYALTNLRLNPANPLEDEITIGVSAEEIKEKVLIIVDDVANTGRTLFYACKPLMEVLPKKIEIVVFVDRMHKSFPIKIDYYGLSLATTLQENIKVDFKDPENMAVHLR
jgi:pyrimidine operon attenuation protein/uracil phosphoribosyltransferase